MFNIFCDYIFCNNYILAFLYPFHKKTHQLHLVHFIDVIDTSLLVVLWSCSLVVLFPQRSQLLFNDFNLGFSV